ncbi:hypothetical protein ABGF49_05630 [Helcococcus ovis]|nr:hypothetical protein [Helcococcus ovis]WNZ01350.1 hypothetical protein EQF90_000425 [Helcococcus ovis]
MNKSKLIKNNKNRRKYGISIITKLFRYITRRKGRSDGYIY